MSSTGRAGVRVTDDFYRTPDWCTDALAKIVHKHAIDGLFGEVPKIAVCDPCAGDGAIVHRLYDLGFRDLSAVELVESRAAQIDRSKCGDVVTGDYLRLQSHHLSPAITVVATNPAFSIAQEVAERSFEIESSKLLALLLRVNFLAGKKRKSFFKKHPCDVHVMAARPSFAVNISWQVSIKVTADDGKTKLIKKEGPFDNEWSAIAACRVHELQNPKEVFKVQRKVTTGDSCEYAWFIWYEGCQQRWYRIES